MNAQTNKIPITLIIGILTLLVGNNWLGRIYDSQNSRDIDPNLHRNSSEASASFGEKGASTIAVSSEDFSNHMFQLTVWWIRKDSILMDIFEMKIGGIDIVQNRWESLEIEQYLSVDKILQREFKGSDRKKYFKYFPYNDARIDDVSESRLDGFEISNNGQSISGLLVVEKYDGTDYSFSFDAKNTNLSSCVWQGKIYSSTMGEGNVFIQPLPINTKLSRSPLNDLNGCQLFSIVKYEATLLQEDSIIDSPLLDIELGDLVFCQSIEGNRDSVRVDAYRQIDNGSLIGYIGTGVVSVENIAFYKFWK